MKCDSPMLTPPCPPRPLLLQTSSFYMGCSARDSRHTAALAAEAESREEKAASERAGEKLHNLLLLVVPPPLELVAMEQRRWAQQ